MPDSVLRPDAGLDPEPVPFAIQDTTFRQAVDLLDAGDAIGLRRLLEQHPKLIHEHTLFEGRNYFRSPTLLEFIAENPIRRGRLPENIVEVAIVILAAEPEMAARNEALGLVATGRVPRECKVQNELIALLCRHGADPDRAIHAAAVHGELDAVRTLIGQGARLDLPVAAALGRAEEFASLLETATPEARWLALALAAQFGHASMVETLLDAGEDPNRCNPPGAHAHSTPLHQAALGGHRAVVRLLAERGARLDLRDTVFGGTPADWAAHGGHTELARSLSQ